MSVRSYVFVSTGTNSFSASQPAILALKPSSTSVSPATAFAGPLASPPVAMASPITTARRFADDAEIYSRYARTLREVSVFRFADGTELIDDGTTTRATSQILAAGDEENPGVEELELVAHLDPGAPALSSDDARLLIARTLLNPGTEIRHTVLGFDAEGLPARVSFGLKLDGNAWEYDAVPYGNVAPVIVEDSLIQLESASLDAAFFKPWQWQKFSDTPLAAADHPSVQTLGDTLVRVRKFFVANKLPEARVSLREVGRIKAMTALYSPEQGLTVAIAKALWLTICAGSSEEFRNGPLWKPLLDILGAAVLPVQPATGEPTLRQELDRLARTRHFPFEFDLNRDLDAQIETYKRQIWSEAVRHAGLGHLSAHDAVALIALFSPDVAAEILAKRFQELPPLVVSERPLEWEKFFALIPRMGSYADGDEPLWVDQLLSFFERARTMPSATSRQAVFMTLMDFSAHLQGVQKERAQQLVMDNFASLPLLKTSINSSDLPGAESPLVTLIRYADTLDANERDPLLKFAFHTVMEYFTSAGEPVRAKLPQREELAKAMAELALRLQGSEHSSLIDALVNLVVDSENFISLLTVLKNAAPALSSITTAQRDKLAPILAAQLNVGKDESRFNPAASLKPKIELARALPIALVPDGGLFFIKAAGVLLRHLGAGNYASDIPQTLELLALILPFLEDDNLHAVLSAVTTTLERAGDKGADWLRDLHPDLLDYADDDTRAKILHAIVDSWGSKHSVYTSAGERLNTIKGLRRISPYLTGPADLWRRWLTLIETVSRDFNNEPDNATGRYALAELRRLSLGAILEALPRLPEDLRLTVLSRFEETYRDYTTRSEILENVSIEGLARVPTDSDQEREFLLNASFLATRLNANDPRIEASPKFPSSPNFDRSLGTAHRLINHLTQALTVNRFVLITGPSGIGKSEVGRYLGEHLNWGLSLFNCNRATTQEDMMQKVGVVVKEGASQFLITEGPLADALMNGRLFVLNEINLARPGNLAFLFSILADIGEEFDFYDSASGKVERRRIHPGFRMLATQNPDGPGRKDLNAALKNRAIEIYTGGYSDVELIALLITKYPEIGARYDDGLYRTLVSFFLNMQNKIKARLVGAHEEGYVWNLRHLMRLAEGFADDESVDLKAKDVLQIFQARVGASLLPADRKIYFDELKNHVYQNTRVTVHDIEVFKLEQENLTLAEVYRQFGIDESFAGDVARGMGIIDIPTSARFLQAILSSQRAGYNIWLKGPAGTGKTRLAEFSAKLTESVLFTDTFTPQTDEAQLKGELKPRIFKLDDGTEKLGFEHIPAPLVRALRYAGANPSNKVVCLLDEAAFAKPDVLEELNSLLDREGGLWTLSPDGARVEFLKRPENFRLIMSSNTYGYSGVSLQSEALRSRTQEIFMDFEFSADEIDTLLESVIPKPPSPNTDGAEGGEGDDKTANGSQQGSPQSGKKAKGAEDGDGVGNESSDNAENGQGGQAGQDGDGSGKNSGGLSEFSKESQRFDDALRKQLAGNTYSDIIHSMSELANRVFAVFDEKLKPNTDFEHDELYSSGSRLDIERAIRAVKGMTSNLNVFHRRTDPDGRDYRFSLLMDASGSMKDKEKTQGGLGLAALFMDVFERLGIPYSLDAFNDSYIPMKGFADDLKAVPRRNTFFNWVKQEIWGKGSTDLRDGLEGSLERIRKERKTSPKVREFLFVLTDGDENGGGGKTTVRQQCDDAMQDGIIVVGIGIGGGLEAVKKHFPIHLVENNPQNLPYLIAEFIREYVKQDAEE